MISRDPLRPAIDEPERLDGVTLARLRRRPEDATPAEVRAAVERLLWLEAFAERLIGHIDRAERRRGVHAIDCDMDEDCYCGAGAYLEVAGAKVATHQRRRNNDAKPERRNAGNAGPTNAR